MGKKAEIKLYSSTILEILINVCEGAKFNFLQKEFLIQPIMSVSSGAS